MNSKRKYFKILADAAIPLMGYFLWDWGIYFIFLFYGLDLITREILVYFKSRKIVAFHRNSKFAKNDHYRLLSALTLLLIFALMHSITYIIVPNIRFDKEIISFLTYSEMGIQQGYILIPLIGFAGYAEYKSEFIFTQEFMKTTITELWRAHIRSTVLLISLGLMTLGLAFFLKNTQWLILLIIIISISVYQVSSARKKH